MEIEQIEYKGYSISIQTDENAESPREWDNICIFHILSCRLKYHFGDKNYHNSESIYEAEKEARNNGDIVLPLYIYDHASITISLTPFPYRWDSGQVGFIQVPKKKIIEEFGNKIFTSKLKKKALTIAESEVKTLDTYFRGNVFGYVIDNGDSCFGYYGDDTTGVINEAKIVIDYIIKSDIKKHCQKVKQWIKNQVPLHARTNL